MKVIYNHWHYAIFVFFLCFFSNSYGKDIFTLIPQRNAETIIMPVLQTYTNNSAICLSTATHPLCGLCINGRVSDMYEDYLVRVLFKDKDGKEYVVMESYRELNDSSVLVFEDYCEETALLPDVEPDSIVIYVHNATLHIDNLMAVYASGTERTDTSSIRSQYKTIIQQQSENKADRINKFNKSHKKLWFAGVTDQCMADFSTRMRQLGFAENQNTGGLEYYIGGVFEMGTSIFRAPPSSYVAEFDWRYRHGKNWLTSVKNQGNSQYCSAFSSLGALEGVTNLYYNDDLNLDLSEQEAACCTTYTFMDLYYWGIPLDSVLLYLVNHGVCDETSYPFVDYPQVCRSGEITPQYSVQPQNYRNICNNPDSIKKSLISNGPLVSGYYGSVSYDFNTGDSIFIGGHAMALVGYGTIQAGDKYSVIDNNGVFWESDSIDVRDERVGLTYWIFKNSYYGQHAWEHEGYMYLIFNNPQWMVPPYAYVLPVMTQGVNAEIVWEDSDGDGYYFWGLGQKPESCPYRVPNVPDGDDSNPLKGSLNNNGYLANIGPISSTYSVNNFVNYNTDRGLNRNIEVLDGGVLNISSEVVMANCKIKVKSGGTLIVDGGRLLHADIELESSSKMVVKNNGLVHMKPEVNFSAPIGATVTIESGEIS